jgi:hypothetical protein
MLVGQIAVFTDLHRHATTRTRIAVTRNDEGAITLAFFFLMADLVTLNKACPFRKLNPDVLVVVQSAENWHRQYTTE